jgi:hypothetical protein
MKTGSRAQSQGGALSAVEGRCPERSRGMVIFFSTECLQDWCVLHTLVSTNYPNRILTGSFDNRFVTVNTPKDNTPQPEEVNDLKAQVEMLQAEKLKLEAELKSREEMMSNLLSFIQASK